MSFDPQAVRDVVGDGLSTVCALCVHYWEGRDKGLPGCGKDCGGPLYGRSFPEYQGPVSGEFASWCFVCGEDTTLRLRLSSSLREFGVCDEHMHLFERVDPQQLVREEIYFRTPETSFSLTEWLARPKPQTIAQAIAEVEKYYADKEGRPWPEGG